MTAKTSDGYDYDSFERFGDDLCEILLSYLSVRDKIRLEFMSKQWERLIFNKQNKLIISYLYSSQERPQLITNTNVWYTKKVFSSELEVLVKKFKFINELGLHYYEITDESLEIIANNCLYLKKMTLESYNLSAKGSKNFGFKCGQNLQNLIIQELSDDNLQLFLKFTPNLRSVFVYNHIKPFNGQYLPKLEEIRFSSIDDINDLKAFVDQYHKQIKRIECEKIYNHESEENFASELFLRFKNLESLSFCPPKTYFIRNEVSLKNLTLSPIDVKVNIKWLKQFKNLKILELKGGYHEDEYFEGLESLDVIQLSIHSDFITDRTLQVLSKMRNLFKLYINSYQITNYGVCHLIKSSNQLKSLHLRSKFINIKSIEALSEKANNNPKVKYDLIDWDINTSHYKGLIRFDNKLIPKNLLVAKKEKEIIKSMTF